jgi:site-specific DNA-methyltransferase (adenine-specific)
VKFHPIADCFRLIEGRELDELVEDIRINGLHEAILLYEGQILDGRNRFRACRRAGILPRFAEYEGTDPVGFVVSLNLRRRHDDESQRGMSAARLAKLPLGANQHTGSANLPTQPQAAQLLNVSERTVRSARRVLNEGAPELVQAVDRGEVSVSAAADVAELPKEDQAKIVAQGEREILAAANRIRSEKKKNKQIERRKIVETLAASVAPVSDRYELILGSCSDLLGGPSECMDWIITDPPYPREFLSVYDDLAEVAAHALKPSGSLLCMVGQSYLPEIMAKLSTRLSYHWTIAYLTPGGQATQIFPRFVNTFWKPVLWFTKGAFAGDWIGDTTRSDVNDNDKSRHHWGQSESGMADLMRRFVKPGDSVLDPFMGAGTTGVVALNLGCKFYGRDIDRDAYNQTLARLRDVSVAA